MPKCAVEIVKLKHGMTGVKLSNSFISAIVLPEKGADIYTLEDRQTGIDVLWKRQELRPLDYGRLAGDSQTAWLEVYEGGWQEILPNGGTPNKYKGVELSYHGESSMLPWEYTIVTENDHQIVLDFTVQLYRTPFQIHRRMSLNATSPTLYLQETVTNLTAETLEFMWGHHPAFGAPFLSEHTRLNTSARTVLTDEGHTNPNSPLGGGLKGTWPVVTGKDGQQVDLRIIPGENDVRGLYCYLTDFEGQPEYTLTNDQLNLGVKCTWTGDVFRCLWLWQEMHSGKGFPFYSQTYTMAVEPWSSYPGHGLQSVLESTRLHLTLEPGASLSADLAISLYHLDAQEKA